jgi:transposase
MEVLPAMGRNRTRLDLTAAQLGRLQRLLKANQDARVTERLQFILRAATGRNTLEDLARQAGRSRSTIQNWLGKLEAGGVDGLLDRDTPPGMVSPLASETVQAQFEAGVKSGRWQSAAQIATWLRQDHGIERSRKSIYYWIHKLRSPARSRNGRPKNPKRRNRRVH